MTIKQFLIAAALTACGGRQYASEPTAREQTAGTVGEESATGATGGTGMQDRDPAASGTIQSGPGPSTQQTPPPTQQTPQTQRPTPYQDPKDPTPYPIPEPVPNPSPTPDPLHPEIPTPPGGPIR